MEENNRKGPGVFYAVVGVATLVVAIIGATFAYFSAAATPTGDTVTGQTNNISGADLTLNVSRVAFNGATAASLNLVPAVLTDNTTAGVTAALTAKCENAGYTGCHVYDITISSTQTISEADLKLDLSVTPLSGGSSANWKYLVYQGSTSAATAITTAATSLGTAADDVELHSRTGAAGLTADTPVHYYLMVYLANIDAAQNVPTPGSGETYELGTYNGSLTLTALGGGQVKATFSAS